MFEKLFVEDNQTGGEVTQLDRLVFIGTPVEQTKDLTAMKAQE